MRSPLDATLAARVTVRAEHYPLAVTGGRLYRVLLDGSPVGAARLTPISDAEAADIARAHLCPPPPMKFAEFVASKRGPKPKGRV